MKASLIISTIAASALAGASMASAQTVIIHEPNAASQFERSQGTGDSALPNRADVDATTGFGTAVRPRAVITDSPVYLQEPMTLENGRLVVRPGESLSTRPGDAAN